MRKVFCITILSLFSVIISHSQSNSVHLQHITVADGLPATSIYDILQDKKGNIWLATEAGLSRYNGYSFQNYNTKSGLPTNEIGRIEEDSKGRMWMNSTKNPFYIYNDTVVQTKIADEKYFNWNFNVVEHKNEIWISSNFGMACSSIDSIEFTDPHFEELKKECAYSLHMINQDSLIVVRGIDIFLIANNEINQIDTVPRINENCRYQPEPTLLDWPLLYFFAPEGLCVKNIKTKKLEIIDSEISNARQLVLKNNQLFVVNELGYTCYIFNESNNLQKKEKRFIDKVLSKILFDKDDNLWLASYKQGLYMIPKLNENISNIGSIESSISKHYESIKYIDNKLFIGTDDSHIIIWDPKSNETQKHILASKTIINRILDIQKIDFQKYAITSDRGFFVLDTNLKKTTKLAKVSCKKMFVNDESFILSAYFSTFKTTKDFILSLPNLIITNDFRNPNLKKLNDERTYCSLLDDDNNLWLGNVNSGLMRFKKNDTIHFKDLSPIFNSFSTDLIELEPNLIATSTNGSGLILIKEKSIFQIQTELGLSSDICYNMDYQDDQLAIATNLGLSIISELDFDKRIFKVDQFNDINGLASNEVRDVALVDSKAYLATTEGISTIDINNKKNNEKPPKVIIDKFYCNSKKVSLASNYELDFHENDIIVHYYSPNFSKRKNITYAYMLDGIDPDWIYTTSLQTHYSNIPPGEYTFNVKVVSDKFQSNAEGIEMIRISIKNNLLNSSFFKLLIGLLFILFAFFSIYAIIYRRQKITLQSLVEEKTVELNEKIGDLDKANEDLKRSNEALEQYAYVASHDLQEPLNTVIGFSQLIEDNYKGKLDVQGKEFLDIIKTASGRMKDLIKGMLVFSQIGQKKNFEIVDCNKVVNTIRNDMRQLIHDKNATFKIGILPKLNGSKLELRLLFQNLISNALKFNRPGIPPEIHIFCNTKPSYYEFKIIDNGIGIDKEESEKVFQIFKRLNIDDEYEGTGIGLAHCTKIVALHNGKIWIENTPKDGSIFCFSISRIL